MSPIMFTNDFQAIDPDQDDPMVITVEITEYAIMKTLVNQGILLIFCSGRHFKN